MRTPEEQAEILSVMVDQLILLRKAIILGSVNPGGALLDKVMDTCGKTLGICYTLKFGEEPKV